MRKLFLLCVFLWPVLAFGGEPLMLINPSRETFFNFPSAIVPDKTVTVFLPEPAVPLHQKYPVVFLLGAGPKEAAAVQQVLDQSQHKALLVGINTDEKDLQDTDKLVAFFTQELVPYINSNYPTLETPSLRALAASGAAGAKAVAALLAHKKIAARAALVNPGEKPVSFAGSAADLRVLLVGPREQLLVQQKTLSDMDKQYGVHYATQIASTSFLLEKLNLDYLFAQSAEVELKKVEGEVVPDQISLGAGQTATLSATALLANRMRFDVVPAGLRLSPPYLEWQPAIGQLKPLPGASAGKVKISFAVDKMNFTQKIRLKK